MKKNYELSVVKPADVMDDKQMSKIVGGTPCIIKNFCWCKNHDSNNGNGTQKPDSTTVQKPIETQPADTTTVQN